MKGYCYENIQYFPLLMSWVWHMQMIVSGKMRFQEIIPKYTNNSNALGDKITTHKLLQNRNHKYNPIDLPQVLNYVQGLDIHSSDPTGATEFVSQEGLINPHLYY